MRIYISCDMEGATGIAVRKHVDPASNEYNRFRRLMTGDVNAAVDGAFTGGATEVLVNDGHGPMTNILIEELDARAHLISGDNKQLVQMEGVDRGFDGAFFVAYHSREGGLDGTLNHSFMSRFVEELRVNGRALGESGVNAGLAAAFGVPILLVTGDDKVGAEARDSIPGVQTVTVKTSVNRHVSDVYPPKKTAELIREAARLAVERLRTERPRASLADLGLKPPFTFEVDFKVSAAVSAATLFPTVKRIGPKSIAIASDDYVVAFKQFWGALLLGGRASE